jgi:hypothetical protein
MVAYCFQVSANDEIYKYDRQQQQVPYQQIFLMVFHVSVLLFLCFVVFSILSNFLPVSFPTRLSLINQLNIVSNPIPSKLAIIFPLRKHAH